MNTTEHKLFTVSEEDGVVRVDKFLAAQLPHYSRAALHKLFELGHVRRDDERLLKPGEKLRPGATFSADVTLLEQEPDVIELPILYEDDDVIVVDKPAGIISHARGRFWQEASVASFIRTRVADMSGERAGIVHRLDRATSGIMICAKRHEALRFLQKQFHDRKVTKSYVALVARRPEHDEAVIDAPIGRNPRKPKEFHVDPNGKTAQTAYKVSGEVGGAFRIDLTPKTGRTHQLRVHLNYIGCPIIGDELYGGKPAERLYLHAHTLQIRIPSGQDMSFESPLPKEFASYGA